MLRYDKSYCRVGAFIEGATYQAFTKGVDDVVEKSARHRRGDFVVAGHYPVTSMALAHRPEVSLRGGSTHLGG